MVGVGTTVTLMLAVSLQPDAFVPVTVYTVVVEGLAVTEAPLVALKPDAGLHIYELAPDAFSVVEPPLLHIDELPPVGVTLTLGNELTVIVTVVVSTQPGLLVPITE